jgi:mRNA interferase RelE/StbE
MYDVQIGRDAEKFIRKQDKDIQRQLLKKLHALADNPRPAGYETLKGTDVLFRIRSGDYRIVYTIEENILRVLVVAVGHRKDIYRKL